MIGVISVFVGAYVLLIAGLYVFQRGLMYQPGQVLAHPSETLIPEAVAVDVSSEPALVLTSWFIAPKDGRPTVLYFQGNAGTVADRDFKARVLADAGIGIWLTGYRGFAGNPGRPTEAGLYADAQAALSALGDRGITPADIVVYGESLGTGVAVHLAADLARAGMPVRAVILEAPFTSMGDAAQSHYPYVPAKYLVRDRYDSLSKIGGIGAPLLLMHGDDDRVVPEAQGRRLFEKAAEPKRGHWIAGGGHSNLYDHGVAAEVVEFIESL